MPAVRFPLKAFPRGSPMRIPAPLCLALLASLPLSAMAQTTPPSPVAQTPPMGWNSWNYFAEKVTDKDIRASADQIVATGMKDAGYIYVNIDNTWEADGASNA